jgi:hypothetical protein
MSGRKRGRPAYWTEDRIVAAFQRFYDEHGKQPSHNDCLRHPYLPSSWTCFRVFGSFSNACVAAGFEGYPPGGADRHMDEETAVIIERIGDGKDITLKEVAGELGITGQALGRRIAKYRRMNGMEPMVFPRGKRPVA